jgi:opacity protein-like surface antigen
MSRRAAQFALVALIVGASAGPAAAAPTRLAAMTKGPPAAGPPRSMNPSPMTARVEPYARPYRLAISFAFGFGSVDMERIHDVADRIQITGVTVDPPKSNLQINAEFAFRYYFPYFVLAQVGFSAVYNKVTSDYSAGPITGSIYNDNLIMEVPILVGGYYTFIDRLYVFAAVGPSVYFYPRSWWDIDGGGVPDFKADMGVGFTFMTGADFMITDNFAVGLELRYRGLRTDELKERKSGITVPGDYDLDFSGVSLAGVLRAYAF